MNCLILVVLSACAAVNAAPEKVNGDLKVSSIDRTIDLSSQLAKVSQKIVYENAGKSPVGSVHFAVDPEVRNNVAFIGASVGKSSKVYLRPLAVEIQSPQGVVKGWKIDLKEPIGPGKSQNVDVEVILGGVLEMYPKEITQKEKQLVLFTGNHYAFSPYAVNRQSTKVTLSSSNIELYSKLKPVSQSGSSVSYGPYSGIAAFSRDEMTLHYENNKPFLEVTNLIRTIEVSMWGNIAVEEMLDVRHVGAKLKGSFSRLDFQRENSGVSSIKNFKTYLPASAFDVYYRDEIGNISTSALRVLDDSVEVDLRPRFPLFGGWKTHYRLGYNVPSYEYLYNKGQNFALQMRVLDHIYDDMLVDEFTLKIILPEGSQNMKLETPYPVKREKDSLHYTYLDTMGRPVVTVKSIGRMTEKHIEDFQLYFEFSKMAMAREPLLLIIAFLTFFVMSIIYVRLDFAIAKDEGQENRLKVAGYCEKVTAHQDKRAGNYSAYESLLATLKSTKDVSAFQANCKKVLADHKTETTAISNLSDVLKTLSPDANEKISELQKQDRMFREHQTAQAGLVEKLVTGKLAKQGFIDQEGAIIKKKDECLDKINSLLAQLRSA